MIKTVRPDESAKQDSDSQDRREWHDLFDRMSKISEECLCAGGMHDNEYHIWKPVPLGSRSRTTTTTISGCCGAV